MNRIFIFQLIESFPRTFHVSYWWQAIIQLIVLCKMLQNCLTLPMLPITANFHSVCRDSRSFYQYAIYKFGKGNPVVVWEILYVCRCCHMVRSIIKNDRTHISFYFLFFSYTSYIVGINLVNCCAWSLCNDLGSTIFSILTINFDRKRYKPKSLILYDAVMLRTLHNNWSVVL